MRLPGLGLKALLWSEHQHQAAVMDWAERMSGVVPELRLLHAIPNGSHRHIAVAGKLKAEGVKAGVPDLCLPIPRPRKGHVGDKISDWWNGLYLEIKTPRGRLTCEQREWLAALNAQGYRAEVARGYQEAVRLIEDYLRGRTPSQPR